MKLKVLGCHGSRFPGQKLTSFLIDGILALDAGAIVSSLTLEEQMKIKAILLTHSHFDHIKDIFFLPDNLISRKRSPLKVYSIRKVIYALKRHAFNNVLWPDFTKIPDTKNPVLVLKTIPENKRIQIEGFTIEAISVNHSVPCVGYSITKNNSTIVYSGDTGPTDELWEKIGNIKNIKGIILETSFPDKHERLANLGGHLTPKALKKELEKIETLNCPVYISHLKPQFKNNIIKDIMKLRNKDIRILQQGKTYNF
ncbi:MAG: hypothetical protein A3C43_03065 [Candidatus Schekmanbacteria bacterium RIFCSPHIGHO2_02_FULL_38_11]|uniref:Metallo-beta-lactamase domain-containing protein n=1 Tax=Candidatus Schekmanbacteria bacterium RIFCSPLOWO2_12_FULL_38_15 TaxID=1817883 RepID=A0A1F7SED9_9BACT|nr:MAG: hypothetical protein A2043_01970 [Candidatus Schekmanbacteria bacterium GWA2_38_9]OGL49490.1 MAG: hypothetical protein A3H37_10320 [Candidatus Schekmanbacteria bacterium RIFCSPLOWO2_02_FULL_38_14]OGL52146.1 MAG: hypothetical protein A3G31_06930 [Candidatus Schekmanbacteria bacterium RIFCSPLOWO2_12_FULL_38_15]OGL53598.1 MAG: hypothetical protein A3C43_03065 [Candidatus Schekmanbacteria bacterium RIFCSPHIGHO2_02_FULL_38_11]